MSRNHQMTECARCFAAINDGDQKCPACGLSVGQGFAATLQQPPSDSAEHTPTKFQKIDNAIHNTASDGGRFVAGTVLAKRYRILGLLGRGGMGEVYKAEDLKLEQTVALKFLPENLAKNEDALKRFLGEVRTARQVSHENVCRVFDIGDIDGKHFISMEFVDGDDLSQLLRRIGRLPSDKAVEISRQICMGLNAIHKAGILHRDLKPANIIIDSKGLARITDFGIAGFEADVQGAESRVGTPAYMSPEQITGKEVTQKSDIYSLGLLIYEIFTGKQAFEAESVTELISIHQSINPTNPSELVEHLDPLVEKIINRCVEKSPSDRPPSALHVAMALPGGNPLQVALEAGETPTPEMVAAAPKKGVLKLPVALTLLAVFIGLFGVSMYMASNYDTHAFAPLEKSPEVLRERSRAILNNLGYTDAPNDYASGFEQIDAYKNYLEKTDSLPDSWERLRSGQPLNIYFWYRQSFKSLEPIRTINVSESNPPLSEPGTEYLRLDVRGRLVILIAVPKRISPQTVKGETNWKSLFEQAGLDIEKFTKTDSKLTPPVYADERTAWQGTLADFEDIPIRVEAAAYQGKPVYFRVVPIWDDDLIEQDFGSGQSQGFDIFIFIFITFIPILGAIILSYFNLKSGRGDIKGAVKISIFYFFMIFVPILIFNDRIPTINNGMHIFFLNGGVSLILFLFYIAVEPFVRRWLSEILISWNRLLAGDFTDPMIGRDILIGGILGFFQFLTFYFGGFLGDFLVSKNLTINYFYVDSLEGTRATIDLILRSFGGSVFTGLQYLTVLLVFYLIFRKNKWAAILIISLFLISANGITFFPSRGWSFVLFISIVFPILLYFYVRFGLLTLISGFSFVSLLNIAITFDTSRFYFSNTLIAAVIGLAIALYAFYISIGDQKIFEGRILKE